VTSPVNALLSEATGRCVPFLASSNPVALGAVARTIAEELEPAPIKRRLVVDVKIPEDITVPGDPLLLHLAVSNLVQNAVDFSPADGRISAFAQSRACQRPGYAYEHGPGAQLQRSPGVDPKSIVEPSEKVTVRPLNACALGSVAGQPEIVILVPG
jgi:K+-sensing histidine kinase KdpD